MKMQISKATKGEVVNFKNPDPAFYKALGHDGMQKLMYDFYDKIYESDIANFFLKIQMSLKRLKLKILNFLYKYVVDHLFTMKLCKVKKI